MPAWLHAAFSHEAELESYLDTIEGVARETWDFKFGPGPFDQANKTIDPLNGGRVTGLTERQNIDAGAALRANAISSVVHR